MVPNSGQLRIFVKIARRLGLRAANSCAILVFSCFCDIILWNRGLDLYVDNYIYYINLTYEWYFQVLRFSASVLDQEIPLNQQLQPVHTLPVHHPSPACLGDSPKSSSPHLAISMCCQCPWLRDPSPVHCKLQHSPPAYHLSLWVGDSSMSFPPPSAATNYMLKKFSRLET